MKKAAKTEEDRGWGKCEESKQSWKGDDIRKLCIYSGSARLLNVSEPADNYSCAEKWWGAPQLSQITFSSDIKHKHQFFPKFGSIKDKNFKVFSISCLASLTGKDLRVRAAVWQIWDAPKTFRIFIEEYCEISFVQYLELKLDRCALCYSFYLITLLLSELQNTHGLF